MKIVNVDSRDNNKYYEVIVFCENDVEYLEAVSTLSRHEFILAYEENELSVC